ncbi:hypothetical protein PHYBLDRAFT_166620 [Phycomyces blakesleeanus NRRL 1555(-)]|uniref:Uncharacterized protein n=1 Tax=Phycomyces blakesleeanus (strain ATCC 8743b / DSM 1359 / FGSC 10004 / NBRC 33097 / NRRL 1555) TaxID=763407 RepID=A0A162UD64_PHYB8|nr:hypothetical protein PHYBLDRAFT_166620 [Phycomyces blakesleeanus NRRL 1555(-)]OAD75372.1 hypothetical protein PHYBLDRAFT_166620 [Phycomyces blakesleeanus NRRL 1555(-)]|eukprot:XP_018293412.1 hypothetical protein PHYBLDRAFT_166620 [Phycomyces blakesleeanus NRRL 1555(-)]
MSNPIIYDISNIQNVLVNLSLEGIKMLPFKVVIPVKASEWRRCLDQSNTLCSTKWNKKRHLDSKEYIFGETRQCHRAVIYISERDSCPAQKESKACECNGALKIKQFKKSPTIITFCMTRDHNNHVPGDRSEIRTLLLPFEAIKLIEDQLRSGSSCRSTRISVLRQIDSWGVGVRKPNYEEIYNRIKKMTNLLYMFNSDEKTSIAIWMNEKLPERNYCIFTRDLCVNNIESNLFAFGFQLPAQVRVMRIATSFCLDATHGISARSGEVMYSLVTQYKQTNLDNKVRLDASFTSGQLAAYKQELKNKLKYILMESNEEVFLIRILDFKCDIPDQLHFLRYFEIRWNGSKVLLKRWGRPYVDDSHRRYLTNNYIESWHNQLKTIYFGCARIRRLNRLVFDLTNDVEYFYEQEVDCIHLNNGKMGLTIQRDVNHLAMQRPAVLAEEEEVVIVDKEDGREDVVGAQNDVDTSTTDLITHTSLLHHQSLDLEHANDF